MKMIVNKILPIIDNSRSLPSFYVAKNLKKDELEDIIALYEYLIFPKAVKVKSKKETRVN